jgi:hypothetical protein
MPLALLFLEAPAGVENARHMAASHTSRQSSPRLSSTLRRRAPVWEILPDLFLGDRGDAGDRERLRQRGITHIVNCAKELSCPFEGQFAYLWLRMEDPDPRFAETIPQFCRFIDEGRKRGKVLVHCTGGVSRSPAIILAYLCGLEGNLRRAVGRLSPAVQTGIDEDFLTQLASVLGVELTPEDIKALQWQLLGRS